MSDRRGLRLGSVELPAGIIPLLWFCRPNQSKRQEIEDKLQDIINNVVARDSISPKQYLSPITWIRNDEPTLTHLKRFVQNLDDMKCRWALAACDDSPASQTIYLIYYAGERGHGCLRTSFEQAVKILLRSIQKHWIPLAEDGLADVEHTVIELGSPLESSEEWTFVQPEVPLILPAHLSNVPPLCEEVMTLFALAKLTDFEIKRLREGMNDEDEKIIIHNWPNDIPASDAEIYSIFQHFKPPAIPPCEESFIFVIDVEYLQGPRREPAVFYIKHQASQNLIQSQYSLHHELNLISGDFGGPRYVKGKWQALWTNPAQTVSVNSIIVNRAFDRPPPWSERSRAQMSYPYTVIKPPSIPLVHDQARTEFTALITCPITTLELRAIRSMTKVEEGAGCFIQLNLKDDSMETLLEFFDSGAFRQYSKPGSSFCVIDRACLQSLMKCWPKVYNATWDESPDLKVSNATGQGNEDRSFGDGDNDVEEPAFMIFASSLTYDHDTSHLVTETPGYQYARIDLSGEDNLRDVIANTDVGNMFFEEMSFAFMDEDIEIALWPEYEGLSKEFLNVEWT